LLQIPLDLGELLVITLQHCHIQIDHALCTVVCKREII
jgi:hypothetical protein